MRIINYRTTKVDFSGAPSTRERRGVHVQGMVEFALVLPLLLLLMLGLIEVGRLLFLYSVVFTSVREAARYGSAAGFLSGSLYQYQDCSGIRAAAKRLGVWAGIQDSDITITYDRVTESGVSPLGSCPIGGTGPALTLGNRVTVRIAVNYQPIVPIPNLPSFPISTTSSRTILKNISIEGTPIAASSTLPTVYFRPPASDEVTEGNEGESVTVQVDVLLSEPAEESVTVNFSLGGSATRLVDYTIDETSPLYIPAGQTLAEINITVIGDNINEFNETVAMIIDSTVNAQRVDPYIYELTINDDDATPTVTFNSPTSSVREDWPEISVTVQVEPTVSGKEIQVPFSFSGTATPGGDYTPPASPLIIPPGSSSAVIAIPVINDSVYENVETVVVTMGTPVNANPGAITVHTATITDDPLDVPPVVSFTAENQTVSEAAGTLLMTAHLVDGSGNEVAAGMEVSVPFSVDGTADLDLDYTISSTPLIIPVGSSRADIVVYMVNDGLVESDETIVATMGSPTNAARGSPAIHTATVTSEPVVFFTLATQNATESSGRVDIEIQRLPVQMTDVTVPFVLGGTAIEGQDYTPVQSGELLIPAGQASVNLSLNLAADGLDELDETVQVTLGTPTNATLGSPNEHVLTILDSDPLPVVTFDLPDQSVDEAVGNVVVLVQLSAISSLPVTVQLSPSGSAIQGTDYIFNQLSVDIPAGSSSAAFTVQVIDDTLEETYETIVIGMEQPTNAVLGTPSAHTISILASDLPTCDIFHNNPLTFSPDGLALGWSLSNLGTEPLILRSLTISWPTGEPNAPKLDKIFFDANLVFDGNEPHSPQTVSSWMGYDSYRMLTTSLSSVVLKFTRSLDPGTYVLSLVFHNVTHNFDCTPVQASAILQP